MADVTVSITGANNDTIVFNNDDFILENGVAGFGRPPVKVRIDESATAGGVWRFSRVGIREIDMPVFITAPTRADLEFKLRRFAKILDDTNGGVTIKVTYANGEVWQIVDAHYTGGAKTVSGEDSLATFARWVLNFQCPQPFWVRQQAISYTASGSATGRGLFSPNTMVNMKVAASQVLGSIAVDNSAGDVPSPPKFVLTGPLDSATFTYNGTGFTYNAVIAAGSSVYIDTAAGTVVDGAGVNKYANLSTAPKFFNIPAGLSTVSMTAVNTTTATKLQMNFQPRKEVVH